MPAITTQRLLVLAYTLFSAFRTLLAQPLVHTKNGTYAGILLPTFDQDFWGGIPFSQPAQRLQPALSLNESFSEVRQATGFGVGCAGIGGDDAGLSLGEDCLTLNVIRPTGTTPNSKLPVVVWIYGKQLRICNRG
jgi:carboxylesterase type B